MSDNSETKTLGKVIHIDEAQIQDHLGELVRGTVEETLNAMLDAETDAMCGAQRYERSPDRVDTRAGHYNRKFHTKAGEVDLKMPKLRKQTFETAIIERYKRRETSIEEGLCCPVAAYSQKHLLFLSFRYLSHTKKHCLRVSCYLNASES